MIFNGGEFEGRRYVREDLVDLVMTQQLPARLVSEPFSLSGTTYYNQVSSMIAILWSMVMCWGKRSMGF
jgi:hypothetical protein